MGLVELLNFLWYHKRHFQKRRQCSYILAQLDHPPGGLKGVIGDVVGLQLEGLQLGERGTIVLLTLRCHLPLLLRSSLETENGWLHVIHLKFLAKLEFRLLSLVKLVFTHAERRRKKRIILAPTFLINSALDRKGHSIKKWGLSFSALGHLKAPFQFVKTSGSPYFELTSPRAWGNWG